MAETEDDFSSNYPIPPPTFSFLVESLMIQTQMQLGILSLGDEEENPEANLDLARHSLDLLAMLQQKTRGNLTADENRLLENGLTELRFRFVQVSDELEKDSETPGTPLIISTDGGKGSRTD